MLRRLRRALRRRRGSLSGLFRLRDRNPGGLLRRAAFGGGSLADVAPLGSLRLGVCSTGIRTRSRLSRRRGVARLCLRAEPRLCRLERQGLHLGIRRGYHCGGGVFRLTKRRDGIPRARFGVSRRARRLLELRSRLVEELTTQKIEGAVVEARAGERFGTLERPNARAKRRGLGLGLVARRFGVFESRASLLQRALGGAKGNPQLGDAAMNHRLVGARRKRGEEWCVGGERGRHGD